jgi:cell division protein FtsB
MPKYQKSSSFRRFLESWPVLGILAMLVFFIGWGVLGLLKGLEDTSKYKSIAERKVQELEERKLRLTADISNLETDAGKEKIFRENYGLAKEGEGVVVVVDEKKPEKKEEKDRGKGVFGFFKNMFK